MSSIRFWQTRLQEVYPNRDKSPDYMMAHAYTACSDLGRLLIRNDKDHRRETAVIGAVSWLISLANHFDIDYESAVVRRFPSVCSYCLGRPCRCDETGKLAKHRSGRLLTEAELQDELAAQYNSIRNANTEITWEWLRGQLAAIYPSNRALLSKGGQAYVVGKMLEEGGELHRAYSGFLLGGRGNDEISVELADLTAWVVSCWDLDGIGRELGAEIASLYVRGCFRCKVEPCNCPTYSITKSQEDLIREIAAQLRTLQNQGVSAPAVDDALATAEKVNTNPTPEAKRSLLTKLGRALEVTKSVRDGSTAVRDTANNLSGMVDMLGSWVS